MEGKSTSGASLGSNTLRCRRHGADIVDAARDRRTPEYSLSGGELLNVQLPTGVGGIWRNETNMEPKKNEKEARCVKMGPKLNPNDPKQHWNDQGMPRIGPDTP